jgi:hypothetical protein
MSHIIKKMVNYSIVIISHSSASSECRCRETEYHVEIIFSQKSTKLIYLMKKSKRERDVNIPDTNFIGRDIIIKILFAFGY